MIQSEQHFFSQVCFSVLLYFILFYWFYQGFLHNTCGEYQYSHNVLNYIEYLNYELYTTCDYHIDWHMIANGPCKKAKSKTNHWLSIKELRKNLIYGWWYSTSHRSMQSLQCSEVNCYVFHENIFHFYIYYVCSQVTGKGTKLLLLWLWLQCSINI